jgi:high-affinity Fe2+/Pb2+ permease
MRKPNVNHAVVVLGFVLAFSVYALMTRFGVPERIAIGSGMLSILVVAIFWSAINLTSEEDEDQE